MKHSRTLIFSLLVATVFPSIAIAGDEGYSGRDIIITVSYQPGGDAYEPGYGGNLFSYRPDGGFGPYIGFVASQEGHDPFYDDLALNAFGDPIVDRFTYATIFNAGVTHDLFGGLMGYAGVGWAKETGYAQKYDPMGVLSNNNYYYVRDTERDDRGFNGNAGVLWVGDAWTIEVGYNSYDGGAGYVGIGYRFPVPK